ncbi:glycosyltransferase, partial [Mycoplasma marinum]
ILHSSNEWIESYFTSNILRKKLFMSKIKKIDNIAVYPHHRELSFFPKEKMITITPFHKKDVIVPKKEIRNKVIYCSRVEFGGSKQIEEFIRLSEINHGFEHTIMGSGDKRDIERVIKEVETHKNLNYFGKYDSESLSSAFAESVCQVITSRTDGEGFPIVFIEAARCGVPIFIRRGASRSIDILVKGNIEWFLYDDISELPKKIDEIKNNYEKFSNQIREFYNDFLSYEYTNQKWMDLIK